MVKITISGNDILALFRNSNTKAIALHLFKNVIKSKFGYGALQDRQSFYFASISEKTLKELIKLIEEYPEIGTSAEFITGLYYVQKQQNKKDDSEALPF